MTLHKILDWETLLYEWDKLDSNGTDLAAIRALCQIDLAYLLVKVCNRTDMLHPFLLDRIREFEAAPDGHLDLWAREHYKSTIITYGGTIQEILNNPEITIGIFSHTGSIAEKFLNQIKLELESNEVLKQAFPDILYNNPSLEAPAGTWNMSVLTVKRQNNPKEGTLEAHGLVKGMPTGRHFQLLVYDDVVTQDSVTTPEQVQKTTDSWMLSLALGSEGDRKRYIGTRYSYADTYEEMLKRGAAVPRIHAATDDGTPDGNPVLFSVKRWEELKAATGDNILACQYLQDPIAGVDKMFDASDIKEYEVRPYTLNIYIMCDPARSKKKDSANTAIAVIGIDTANNKYLLDGINHKCNLKERWENFRNLYHKWKKIPGVQRIKAGYESFGARADLDYFEEKMKEPGQGGNIDIVELAWPATGSGAKSDRVQRLTPDLKTHKFLIPYNTNFDKLTSHQLRVKDNPILISKQIKRKDSEGQIYDLSDHFKKQVQFFPHGKVDLIDAISRLYDMDPKKPYTMGNNQSIESDYIV